MVDSGGTASPRRRRKAPAPEIPLGSLSQPRSAAPGPAACPDCASSSLTRLSVSGSGVPAVFLSCHDCERSGWYAADDGRPLDRDSVLGSDT